MGGGVLPRGVELTVETGDAGPGGGEARRRRSGLMLLFLAAVGVFGFFAHGNLESKDSAFTMHAARALYLRGDSGLRGPGQDPQWEAERIGAEYIARSSKYGMQGQNGLYYVWFPIGHQFLMVPFVAAGGVAAALFPSVEEAYRSKVGHIPQHAAEGEFVFEHAFTTWLSVLFGAGSVVVMFLLGRTLGLDGRASLLLTGAIALCTQFFPTTRETLSDGPGMFFLLASLLSVLRYHQGAAGRRGLVVAGLLAGCAVLVRYPHALLVCVLAGSVVWSAYKRRRPFDVVPFALGGLPCLVLLLTVNYLRFGDPGETGYGNAALGQWFNYPWYLGLPKILIAAGKGILWFSPLLWLALPLGGQRGLRGSHATVVAWLFFALPVIMFSNTLGWQSGQCWGIRYVTPGVVVFLFLVLAQARPWRSHPRRFALLCGVGLLVSLTSVLAPTRGQNQLAGQAVRAYYTQQFERGEISQQDLVDLDPADHFYFLPRYSPLHSHWSYAWLSATGRFENDRGYTLDGVENSIEPMFGVTSGDPLLGLVPGYWEDRGARHLWWFFWSALLGFPFWLLALPWGLATALCLRSAVRALAV